MCVAIGPVVHQVQHAIIFLSVQCTKSALVQCTEHLTIRQSRNRCTWCTTHEPPGTWSTTACSTQRTRRIHNELLQEKFAACQLWTPIFRRGVELTPDALSCTSAASSRTEFIFCKHFVCPFGTEAFSEEPRLKRTAPWPSFTFSPPSSLPCSSAHQVSRDPVTNGKNRAFEGPAEI